MTDGKDFAVIQLAELRWPKSLTLPSPRFRLFVAAHTAAVSTPTLFDFALAAVNKGMVYFCSWGSGCERFHDIVDKADIEVNGQDADEVIMTTWHDHDTFEEALDFFATCAVPSDGLAPNSDFRLVLCWGDAEWAKTARELLEAASFFV